MFPILIIIGAVRGSFFVVNGKGDLEECLMDRLKDDYVYLYDYKYVSVPLTSFNLVFPSMANVNDSELPSFNGSDEEIINQSVNFIKEFDYNYSQSNPSRLLKEGEGNCHSMSIVLNKILHKHGLSSDIVIEEDHAYNLVEIKSKSYKIDIAKELIEIEEVL